MKNDQLVRLVFFIGCLKDAGAAKVTVLAPYLSYARKDRKTQPRDPVTTRYLAQLLEAAGTDRLVTLEVHNLAAFRTSLATCRRILRSRSAFDRSIPRLPCCGSTCCIKPTYVAMASSASELRSTSSDPPKSASAAQGCAAYYH